MLVSFRNFTPWTTSMATQDSDDVMTGCRVPHCDRFAKFMGVCLLHAGHKYERSARSASASPPRSHAMMSLDAITSPATSASGRRGRSRWCAITDCQQLARIDGLCTRHNMQLSSQKRKCSVNNCTSYARTRGLCTRHGGGKLCSVDGCKTVAQSGGVCRTHGGGSRCKHDDCNHFARVGGFCGQHMPQRANTSG
ncbi:hypothetical protein SPRG_01279 [Saprolegnia parasitica CBS 223.65]|uniref:WRKY19-like zinc finger domain-containing protein n=1 Tax=Saprolegnia parasitica (strain CBS 223.65) TaxID=695850 RepID=A0A067CXK7_SAPPC|nr:hypothetical protein SPRG_01279 [Saprolegnia parasitica CBS 223.65]KDO34005.1 hypothetical protein SPRG_01279 [Saprolegnia parasitica CBS 223.65]|eukprot:XP_012194891.1 hypothetical protein SPRG_01279 [Saprolegnia parasitica CBS 223.65]